jgi:Ca2+-binding RTX toxin-like protein
MVLVTVTAGVALAVTKTCNAVPCKGTDNEDVLHEQKRHDRILAYEDNDLLDANNYFHDRDVLKGGSGSDELLANDRDGRDILRGGAGRDRCYGDRGDAFVNCNVRSTRAADFADDVE